MTTRATPTEVKAVNGSTLTDPQVQRFIDVAHIMVDAAKDCAQVNEATLLEAEIYLTCHLMENTDGGGGDGRGAIASESIEDFSTSYSSVAGNGIKSSSYGQIADTLMHGCLGASQLRRSGVCFSGGA